MNRKLKFLKEILMTSVICFLLMYIIFVFVLLETNPKAWTEDSRITFVAFSILTIFMSLAVSDQLTNSNNNE